MSGVRAIAIVLARAGSKGVPGKNTAMLAGKPCIAWTLAHARAARTIATLAVSSDDPRALAIAQEHGAIALPRPAVLASDQARVDDAARHALEQLSRAHGVEVTARTPVVLLYANVPVRPAGLIDRAVELLHASGCDSVQSYQPAGKHHPWWTARVDAAGRVAPWEGSVLNHGVYRRQDLPPAFVPDGAVLVCTAAALRLELAGAGAGPHAFFGVDRRGVLNPEGSVVDIDSPLDLAVARAVLEGAGVVGAVGGVEGVGADLSSGRP